MRQKQETVKIASHGSVNGKRNNKSLIEVVMNVLFFICGITAVVSVAFITLYMIVSGGPAIFKIGVTDFLFGDVWNPDNNQFGILPMILASIVATVAAVLIALPIGLFVAVFLSHIAPKRLADIVRPMVDLLSGIPSVVYGLLGAILIVPMVFKLQEALSMPTSGCLLSAVIVLVIMILPTIISVSENALRAVPPSYYEASTGLGGSQIQGIFRVVIPAAKSGIVTGMVLGTGRAIGETMAVMMVAGNSTIMPELLKPVRLLTVSIPFEWAYSSGLHREALYGIGLVLFLFIMLINLAINRILKKGEQNG